MLYLLHGTDIDTARVKALELVSNLQKKKPDAELFRIDSDNWNQEQFDGFIESQGLFERKFIVLVNKLFENRVAKEIVLKKLEEIKKSENIFIFLECQVDTTTLKEFNEFAEKVQVCDKEKVAKKDVFNMFSLADALGTRDRRNLWVLYQKAVRNGASPEELSGILFWQIKSLILSSETKNAREAGLNPFVFGKSKRFSKNFTHEELYNFAERLIVIYHDAHRGKHDFGVALERFVLSI